MQPVIMCVKVRKNLVKEKILEMGAFAGRSEGMRIDTGTSIYQYPPLFLIFTLTMFIFNTILIMN
jgi:hypothetical protein